MTVREFRSDLGWKWKAYAGRWLLVTDGGGEQVILSAKHHSSLVIRDLESGVLRDISPSDQVAKMIAGAADVRRHALAIIQGVDLGMVAITSTSMARHDGVEATDKAHRTVTELVSLLRVALIRSGGA